MKPHLPTRLLQSLLASFIMSPMLSIGAVNILAEGVNANDVTTSERFYDTGKGYYFNFMGPGYRYLWEDLMDTFDYYGNWNFLGELSQRIPSSTGTAADFKNLTNDGNTCWAQTCMNLVEYWNSYYGVFNTDSRGLLFGRSYSANYLEQTGGTLSLKQNLLFLDTFPDIGGNIQMYLRWYFEGYDNNSLEKGQGGYWKDYFKTSHSSYQYEIISTKEKLTQNILPMLGYTKTTNGSYEFSTKGQIVYLGLDAIDGLGGHAITCYGVQLNDAGQIKALYVVNSDDILYDLFTVYVDDDLMLYKDANHTKIWDYAETGWIIDSIGAIKTPASLKNKLAQYEDVSNPLIWTGETNKWDLGQKNNYSELPNSDTGWNVLVDQKNYPIYYDENRAIVFDDSAKNGSVIVNGKGWANSIVLNNKSLDYIFTGTSTSTSLSTNSFNASNGSAQFNKIKLYSTQATLNNYSLTLGSGSEWTGDSGSINNSSLNLNGSKIDFTQLSFSTGSLLQISSQSTMSVDTLNIFDNVSFVFNSASSKSSSLNFNGDLVLTGDSIDIVLNTEVFTNYGKYALISFSDGLSDWESYFSTLQGDLSYSNNILYINYDPTPSQEWISGDGIWSDEMFGGVEDSSNGSKVFFGGDNDYTVNIAGSVSPAEILVNSSSDIVLTGDNTATISGNGNLIKTNSGTLTIETANSFTGGTLIENGLVVITNQEALGKGEIALAGGKLSVDLSDISSDTELDNNISGHGTIDFSISSTLKITGSNTFEGVVNLISGGTIEVGSSTSLGSASIYLNSGTLDMNGKSMENEIHIEGDVAIDSGRNFLGKLVLKSGTLNGSTRLKIQEIAELYNGTINVDLSGNGSLYIRGDVSMNGDNSVANTIIEGGRLTANTIKGNIELNGGTLAMDNGLNLNSGKSLSFNGGVLDADLTVGSGRTLNINTSSIINGDLVLNGGIIKFSDVCLSPTKELLNINGCLNLSAPSYLNLTIKLDKGIYSLFAFDSIVGELDNLILRTNYTYDSRFYVKDNQLMFEVINCGQKLTWNKKSAVWQEGITGIWQDTNGQTSNVYFTAGDVVVFGNNTGTVTLKGILDPGGIEVNSAKTITFKSDKKTAGQISGTGDLYKYGSGKLSINNGNSNWEGDIYLYGGSIVAGGSSSFGSGNIAVYNGTLDLAKKQISNDIFIDGYGVIKNGKYFSGDLVLTSGTLGKNTSLNIGAEHQALLKQGELVGASLYGAGMVIVDGNVYFNSGTSVKTKSVLVTDSGILNVDSKGLTMDKKASVLDIQSGEVLSDGNLSTYAVTLIGGDLTTRGTKAKSLTTTHLDIFEGSTVSTSGNVSASYLQMDNSKLFVTGITGSQKLSIKYDAGLNDSNVEVCGSMSAGSLWLDSSSILLSDPYKNKAMGLSVKNGLSLSDAALLNCSGKVSVGELNMDSAMIELVNSKSTQSLTVKGNANLLNSDLMINGSMSTKGLYMDYTTITLDDINPDKTQKALGLSAKGDVSLLNSSLINITGFLSAYNLSVTDSRIDIHGETSSQKLSTKYDASLQNSSINVNGSMSVGRGLTLDNSAISLNDPYKNKAMGLSVKKSLSLTTNSRILCTGKISAGELYMDSSMIELSNFKSTQSLSVKGNANLHNAVLTLNGSMSTKGLYMDYTTITLDDINPDKTQKALGLSAKGDVSLLNSSLINITGSLSAYNLSVTDSRIDIHGETSSQKLSTKYDASLLNSSINVNGSMSVGRGLTLDNSAISLNDPYKNKAMGLSVKKDLRLVNGASVCSSGKISASNLSLDGSWLEIYGTSSAQSLATKYDMDFYGSSVHIAGSLSARNFSMTQSMLSLSDPFKDKPMNVSLKGDFSMSSGSILELSGKLSAKNIIFNGGSLNLTSNKLQTITAKSNLCFNDAIDLNWNFDFQPAKSYKIFTFKTFSGYTDDLYSMLGLSSDCCILTLNEKKKYITLEVTDSDLWNTYMTTTTTWGGLESSSPLENDAEEEVGVVEASEEKVLQSTEAVSDSQIFTVDGIINTAAVAFVGASQSDTVFKKLSDSLVQTTWGTVSASQSFASMLGNRGQYATTLAKGKGFAWINTFGGSTRLSSTGNSAGADSFLAGAAVGAELIVSANSGVGVSVGHSRGKVSTFSAYSMDEDATHVALYGQHLHNRHQFSWSAIYGSVGFDGSLAGVDCDWTQDVIQLDLRWDAKMQVNRENYSYLYAGLQYLATNSGEISPDIDSGSVQYLRSKLGAGYTHSINANTHLFGEIAFVADLARNNPTATINLWRSHGSNPGRLGGNLHVGIRHQLSKDWSINASYQLNFMKNLNSHNASIGVSCEF